MGLTVGTRVGRRLHHAHGVALCKLVPNVISPKDVRVQDRVGKWGQMGSDRSSENKAYNICTETWTRS